MPKSVARSRRSVATVTSTAVIGASLAVLLLPVVAPPAGAAAAPGITQRASLASPGNTPSETGGQKSVLSGNGESVAFTSRSKLDNLDIGQHFDRQQNKVVDNENVYVRDLVKNRTVMISRGQFDRQGGGSGTVGLRYGPDKLLNLQPGGGGGLDAPPPPKDTPPNGNSYTPSISADGRFVAFLTEANNIVEPDRDSFKDILICDRDPDGDGNYDENRSDNGTRDYTYYLVTGGDFSFGTPELPKIAANASRIVWEAHGEGTALAAAELDLRAGTIGKPDFVPSEIGDRTELIQTFDPAISGDGNHIVMRAIVRPQCDCDDFNAIVSTDMRSGQAIRVDLAGGKPISTKSTEYVRHPAVNNDGTVIAFVAEQFTYDSTGRPVSEFNEPTTYVVHIADNKVIRTDIVSRDNNFTIINGDRPGLSSDGRYIAFVTNNLKAHDGADGQQTNGDCIKPAVITVRNSGEPLLRLNALPPRRNAPHTTCQVVMRDLIVDHDRLVNELPRLPGTLVSPNQSGNGGNGNTVPQIFEFDGVDLSTAPSLSENGGRVAYDSNATDLVAQPADNNRAPDVFVRTLEPSLRGDAVDFGSVQIGDTSTETAQLTETGFGPLTVEQLSIIGANAGDFAIGGQTCTGQTIHQTGSCQVSIRFTPTAEGARNGQLLVQIRGGRRTTVNLTGTGAPIPPTPPVFEAGPNPLNFGNRLLLSNGPTAAVTVTNNGEADLVITAINIIGPSNPEDYRVASNTCTAPVPGGGQCTVAVAFSPKGSGIRNAVLQFTDNAAGGPHLVGLTGSAPQPTIQVNPGVTPPGRVVTVIGKDFPPGGNVTVKFLDRIGQSVIKAKDDGTFQAPLLIFPKAAPETRTIQAIMAEFATPLGTTPLLIVFPTVSPANFVVRG